MIYRPEIDGLRAIAVMVVIFYHAHLRDWPGGFIGVDVFFVISGYLITTIIRHDLEQQQFSLKKFWLRRVRRILPALYVVLTASSLCAYFVMWPTDILDYGKSVLAVLGFGSNILFWAQSGYFDTDAAMKPLLHTWSLAVEEQFYLIYPLLIWFLFRKLRKIWADTLLLLLLVSFFAGEYYLNHDQTTAFYWFPLRAWELFAGGFAAILYQKLTENQRVLGGLFFLPNINAAPASPAPYSAALPNHDGKHLIAKLVNSGLGKVKNYAGEWHEYYSTQTPQQKIIYELLPLSGLYLILYCATQFNESVKFPGINAALPVLGAILIILFTRRQSLAGRILASKAFVAIGLISYSAYLWHYPIFSLYKFQNYLLPQKSDYQYLIILTLVLAYLSWYFVEQPMRQKSRQNLWHLWVFLGVFGTVLLAFGGTAWVTNGFAFRYKNGEDKINEIANYKFNGNKGLGGYKAYVVSANKDTQLKRFDLNSPKKKIMVIGDSYALDLLNALHESGLDKQLQISSLDIDYNCGPLYGLDVISVYPNNMEYHADENIRICHERLAQLNHPDFQSLMLQADQIWFAKKWDLPEFDQNIIKMSVEKMRHDFGPKVIVFGLKSLASLKFALSNYSLDDSRRKNLTIPISESIVDMNNKMRKDFSSDYIDVERLLCDSDTKCKVYTPDDYPMSYDTWHLLPYGARLYGERLRQHPIIVALLAGTNGQNQAK